MALDLSPAALVDAAGGAALFVVGLLAFTSRGGGAERLWLAASVSTFGLLFVLVNLLVLDGLAPLAAFA